MKTTLLILVGLVSTMNAWAATPTSVYTKLDCKVTEEGNDPIDYFYSTCKGYAGYELFHDGGDLRSWLSFQIEGKRWDLPAFTGGFPYVVAEKLEWRGYRVKGKKSIDPFAVIYRVRATDPQDEEAEKDIDSLVVARVSRKGACVVGAIKATGNPKANEEARGLADANRAKVCEAPQE